MSSKIAIGVIVALVLGSLLLCCVGFVLVGTLAPPPQPIQPRHAPEPSPTLEAPAPAETASDLGPDVKVLRLAPPAGARTEDVLTCVTILNRRFAKARIRGRASLENAKVVVRLAREGTNLPRAGKLLAAGGHLQFLEFISPQRMPEAELKQEIARLTAAKAQRTYDPAKEKYDVLPFENDENRIGLVVLADGIEGHLVASATPARKDNGWIINFTMSPEGADAMERFTKRLLEKQFAVVLDGTIKMVFWSKGVIRERGMMFRNNPPYTEDEALGVTALITSGRLPIELTMEED